MSNFTRSNQSEQLIVGLVRPLLALALCSASLSACVPQRIQPDNPCLTLQCAGGDCETVPRPAGTVVDTFNCHVMVCDGAGQAKVENVPAGERRRR